MEKLKQAADEAHADHKEFITFCARIKAAGGDSFDSDDDVVKFSLVMFKGLKARDFSKDERDFECMKAIKSVIDPFSCKYGKLRKICEEIKGKVPEISDIEVKRIAVKRVIAQYDEITDIFNSHKTVMIENYQGEMPEAELFL